MLDHIAYAFVPDGTLPAILLHTVGRITGPTMFFAAVEGYHHTRNLDRYLLRLAAAMRFSPAECRRAGKRNYLFSQEAVEKLRQRKQ